MTFFQRAFVINLPFKSERLSIFQGNAPSCLGRIEVWPAIHGDSVRHPDWWTAGPGAWGCYRSHLQILEHCYQHDIDNYIVFEDDAIFRPDFERQLQSFLRDLPQDWEQIYLGGQLYHESKHPPRKVTDQVYVPYNVNRTHGFAVHRRGYEKLYKHLNSVPFAQEEHIDHHLGRLHESGRLKIYCPARWLVGQDGGPSNISGNNNGATFWTDPEKCAIENRKWQGRPVIPVFLEAPIEVAVELERRGWHRGKWQNADRLDRGVCNALGSLDVKAGLTAWYKAVVPEAVREGNPCVCLVHPNLTWACVSSLECADFHRIVAKSAEDAEQQLASLRDGTPGTVRPMRRRNLIYHIYPKAGNGVWQWNVQQLLKQIDQFDGIRSVAVVTSHDADDPAKVRAAFEGTRIDTWIIEPNDPQLGEIVTFRKLLETLPKDDSITFRGHAKGVTYANPEFTRDWTRICYEVCLADTAFIDASMEQFSIAGPFINYHWGGDDIKHGYHYAGAFYWFRNQDVFSQPEWTTIQQDRWGAEKWPGNLFPLSEAGSLFGQGCKFLYDRSEMDWFIRCYHDWCANKAPAKSLQRSVRKTISIVIPTIGRPQLADILQSLVRQIDDGDEIIVVADGAEAFERSAAILKSIDCCRVRHVCHVDPNSAFGNAQKHHGSLIAAGDLIWFVDDDDRPSPNAIHTIRSIVRDRPVLFRIRHCGSVIWEERSTRLGNVSNQMLVVPNRPDIPKFPVNSHYAADNEWIKSVEAATAIEWSEEIIYEIERHNRGRFDAA